MSNRSKSGKRARRVVAAICMLLAWSPGAMSAAEVAWPERIVTIDEMHLRGPLQMNVPTPRAIDRSRRSTVVLHILVDEQGRAAQVRIEQSSGNPSLDETVLRAASKATFEPYRVDGQATAVTVVAPMHFPFAERRR